MRPTSAFQHALRLARFESSLDPRHLETRLGPHAGRQALTLYSVPPELESPDIPLLARLPGFSLHAATMCEAHQRRKLEKLCRYITRPTIVTDRLSLDGQGRVVYRYKRPFRDGSTHVVLAPLDFMARLAALVPRPQLNLTRFHRVFAPNWKHRDRIVPQRPPGQVDTDKPKAPMTWMQRLKRMSASGCDFNRSTQHID